MHSSSVPSLLRRLSKYLGLVFVALLFDACDDTFKPDDGLDYSGVAKHYVHNIYWTNKQIKEVSQTGQTDFIFLTDTHLADNCLDSPAILSFLLQNGISKRVFWGGDAISAYGDIQEEWKQHQQLFLNAVKPWGHYYMVRGNHEFSSKNKTTGRGTTLDALQTARLLNEHREPDIVRPDNDPESCYYFVDDHEKKLRFCIFDTTDSIQAVDTDWGTIPHMNHRQLEWMNQNALHHVPAGFGLIILTHIGILEETYYMHGPYEPLRQLLHQAEAPVLLVLSGHLHQDFQTYDDGILHVLTGSDATYPEYSHSPFLHDYRRRWSQQSSQLIDCISISPDRKTIDALRIGAGYNRTFHLDPIQISLSKGSANNIATTRLSANKVMRWDSYDATGYTCSNDPWQPPSTIVSISANGTVRPLQTGSAVVMATDKKGHKEFFPIQVIP